MTRDVTCVDDVGRSQRALSGELFECADCERYEHVDGVTKLR
jgi:hypothetical protein